MVLLLALALLLLFVLSLCSVLGVGEVLEGASDAHVQLAAWVRIGMQLIARHLTGLRRVRLALAIYLPPCSPPYQTLHHHHHHMVSYLAHARWSPANGTPPQHAIFHHLHIVSSHAAACAASRSDRSHKMAGLSGPNLYTPVVGQLRRGTSDK
ncbi:hypothetical protein COCVIDRAFT_12346 [Bipolaris victoriae FI3]|uniref:Secreted protein n=1 Tax=Bipolaris victoriae (strain FI3) TaxID=930091 RepID=W7ETF9_BIPV3|nr:hypothetical protein COCVIDRAFT_12346 [Bipolaris victoriae FI3]